MVISGSFKGETGRVIKVLTSKNRAIVEGINKAKKHIRPTQDNPQGGIVEKELSINLSNLGLMNKGKLVKVGSDVLKPDQEENQYRFPATVALAQQKVESGQTPLNLQSGMSVTAIIKLRSRPAITVVTDLFTKQLEGVQRFR